MKPWYLKRWAVTLWSILVILAFLAVVPTGISFNLGTIKAQDNLSTSSTTSAGGMDMFSAKRIAVFCRSRHRMVRSVSEKLAEQLQELSCVEQVDLFAQGQFPEAGGELYDQYIVLDLTGFKARGFLPAGRRVTASVKASLGRDFWDSRRLYSDQHSPPYANASANLTLNHKSTSWGYETASSKYALASGNISKQLGKSIAEKLIGWLDQYALIEEMPAVFHPEYQPVPSDLPRPSAPSLQCIVSGRGFMLRNYTAWSMKCGDFPAVMQRLQAALSAQGWNVEYDASPRQNLFIRATEKGRVFEAFSPMDFGSNQDDGLLVMRYYDRVTGDELAPAFETMLNGEQEPAETWLAFSGMLRGSSLDRLMDRFLNQKGLSLSAQMSLVEYLKSRNRKEEALEHLHAAHVLSLLDHADRRSSIERLGRELSGDKTWKPEDPTPAELKAMGFRRLDFSEPEIIEVGLEETIHFVSGTETNLSVVGITVKPSQIPEGLFTVASSCYTLRKGMRTSTTTTPHMTSKPWKSTGGGHYTDFQWHADIEEVDGGRFRLTITGTMH